MCVKFCWKKLDPSLPFLTLNRRCFHHSNTIKKQNLVVSRQKSLLDFRSWIIWVHSEIIAIHFGCLLITQKTGEVLAIQKCTFTRKGTWCIIAHIRHTISRKNGRPWQLAKHLLQWRILAILNGSIPEKQCTFRSLIAWPRRSHNPILL